jgi:branched-chain amino acid transport system permease protein
MQEDTAVVDKQTLVYERWDAELRERVRALITDELIEEHRVKPLGQHSDALERVLHYFRRQPAAGKYIGVMIEPWREYRIGVLPGAGGVPLEILTDDVFSTEEQVLHAIFVRRVNDLRAGAK